MERRDAGQERCWRRGMRDRRDVGEEGCGTGETLDRREALLGFYTRLGVFSFSVSSNLIKSE